jgi:3',5'-cyclic-AMP phosphodiesterase
MLVAHITDLHLMPRGELAYGRIDTERLVRRALDRLRSLNPRPDLVLVGGDIVDEPSEAAYAVAAELLRGLGLPVLAVPGNHDERGLFRSLLAEIGAAGEGPFLQFVEKRGPLTVVGLDTVIQGQAGGELCPERLAFLERSLAAAAGGPTLILAHHPPFAGGVAFMDEIRLKDGCERLEAILAAHPEVLALLCGHHHRGIETLFGGRLCLVTPALVQQVALTLDPSEPPSYVMEPPAFRLLRFDGQRLVSHLAYVEPFGGPHPFAAEAGIAEHLA